MRVLHSAMLAAAVACSTVAAEAATITENFTGTIAGASTTDTLGLFGAPGANLAGQAIAIHTQYVTTLFTGHKGCRISPSLCMYYYSQSSPGVTGSVLTSVTINGKTVVYSPTSYGEVLFSNEATNAFVAYTDATAFSDGLRGSALYVLFASPVAFGVPLSPGNGPVLNSKIDYVEFFTPSPGELPAETLNFLVTGAHP
jgi:hypothetical protein